MANNVYETPQSQLLDENHSDENKPLASTGQRFLNMIIDSIAYLFFSMVVGVILGIVLGITGRLDLLENTNDLVFGLILMSLYFVPLEAIWGTSIGKLITRTKVVNESGGKASFGQVVGRTLVRFVPFEAFSFLGGDGQPRGWHDKWSNTKVISIKK